MQSATLVIKRLKRCHELQTPDLIQTEMPGGERVEACGSLLHRCCWGSSSDEPEAFPALLFWCLCTLPVVHSTVKLHLTACFFVVSFLFFRNYSG